MNFDESGIMQEFQVNFVKLAEKYQTDKFRSGIMQEYHLMFGETVAVPTRLLEMGIFKGGSIHYWSEEYLTHPDSRVIGVDVHVRGTYNSKVALYKCDQMDSNGLRTIAEKEGPFDVVIDDACHRAEPARSAFEVLWPCTKWYVIEDWDVRADMRFLVAEIHTRSDVAIACIREARDTWPVHSIAFFLRKIEK